jgi:hypothetical protein
MVTKEAFNHIFDENYDGLYEVFYTSKDGEISKIEIHESDFYKYRHGIIKTDYPYENDEKFLPWVVDID